MIPVFIRRWFALVYLDEIVVYRKSHQDHNKQALGVLRLPYKAGVTLKLKKWNRFAETIDYLAQVALLGRPKLAEHDMGAVAKHEYPLHKLKH